MQKSTQLDEFLEAALPAPVTLLHQTLKPFSVGHKILLTRFHSPFIIHDRIPELPDLLEAIYVCHHDYDEALIELNKPPADFDAEIRQWLKMCGEFDVAGIITAFFDYLIEACKCPEFKAVKRRGQKRGFDPGAPYLAMLITSLMRIGLTRTEAFNCPYGLAQWLYLTRAEMEGRIVIEDKSFAVKLEEFAAAQGLRMIRPDEPAAPSRFEAALGKEPNGA